ncbi:DUF2157 domain-containing protein [Halobacillus sp. BBL2006]|uniref:DUF2157 domain-containing protein n=1 Tax=Halobacillus sp. BBL2006 TaxID=1543706 RepID=UPI00054230E0|nr:DUF2157 domain-containing protein [Halobacillus sp. BBL2006]KHE67484.1 hypothetical protein LD39_17290 [Halobacillus sp. BBL2006]
MNRDQIVKESKKWVEAHIISESQRTQLIEQYPKKQNKPVLLTFAAIFIGLGFLTFIASNWSEMHDLFRMGIIVAALLFFYIGGEHVYRKRSVRLGISLLLIALIIFGAGIFLTGQMYHYTSFSAFPFLVWSIAGFSLYLLFKDWTFFIATVIITTVGQVYSGMVYQDYHLWIGVLFLFGLGWVVYTKKVMIASLIFAVGYVIHALVLVFSGGFPYYWLIVLFLALYLVDDLVVKKGQIRIFKSAAIVSMLTLNIFQVFFLGYDYWFDQNESSFYFFIVWAVLFVFAVIRSAISTTNYYWIDLILFVPVFRFGFGDVLSLVLLFGYALLWLISGYQQEVVRWVNKGTVALLVTTLLAYFQLAWDFMDRSLFFFLGGLLLFALSFFLERKRRKFHKGGEAS